MEACKKCNSKHDLKKGCPKAKGKGEKLEKETAPFTKSEVIGKSFNDLKKNEIAPEPKKLKKTDNYVTPGMSFAELKKREEEIMALEDKVGSLASHLKDVLKKIK